MKRFIRAGLAVGVLAALARSATAQLPSFESKSLKFHDVDCKGLELKIATGVMPSGPTHTYKFQGSCRLLEVTKVLKSGIGGQSTTYSSKELDLAWVTAQSEWSSVGGRLEENLSVKGTKWSGNVSISLRCPKDPIVTTTSCVHENYVNTTGFDGFDQAWMAKRPLTAGQPFAAVLAASKAGASGGTPNKPAPPPDPTPGYGPASAVPVARSGAGPATAAVPPSPIAPPARRGVPAPNPQPTRGIPGAGAAPASPAPAAVPTRSSPAPSVSPATPGPAPATPPPPAGPILLEAEAFLPAVQVTGGQAGQQPMSGFGAGWGGDAQLFWPATQVGAQLRMQASVPQDGRYRVLLVSTTAPDYGIAEASFDGGPAVSFNGYAPAVGRQRTLLGIFDLRAGPHDLLVTVRGQDNRSRGLFVGLDQLQLVRN